MLLFKQWGDGEVGLSQADPRPVNYCSLIQGALPPTSSPDPGQARLSW